MDKNEELINELKRILQTVDGRDFFYNFFLLSCGVDFMAGYPSYQKDESNAGSQKPAIDIMNMMIYHCRKEFDTMINEQKLRSNSND